MKWSTSSRRSSRKSASSLQPRRVSSPALRTRRGRGDHGCPESPGVGACGASTWANGWHPSRMHSADPSGIAAISPGLNEAIPRDHRPHHQSHPSGVPAISPGLSEAIPRDPDSTMIRTPAGCQHDTLHRRFAPSSHRASSRSCSDNDRTSSSATALRSAGAPFEIATAARSFKMPSGCNSQLSTAPSKSSPAANSKNSTLCSTRLLPFKMIRHSSPSAA